MEMIVTEITDNQCDHIREMFAGENVDIKLPDSSTYKILLNGVSIVEEQGSEKNYIQAILGIPGWMFPKQFPLGTKIQFAHPKSLPQAAAKHN